MVKGIQSQKMVKKPKKDVNSAKITHTTNEPLRPMVTTQIIPKGKAAKPLKFN